ncbi:MAG: sugar transferase [Hyphomicrobiaceae bacterium]
MLPEAIVAVAGAAAAYHHAAYPLALRALAGRARTNTGSAPQASFADAGLPRVGLIIPAHNEAKVIARRIENCAALDYPSDKLEIVIVCDGCADATAELARAAIRQQSTGIRIRIEELTENAGKIAVLNQTIPSMECDIVALSDASAMLEPDAIRRAVQHFADPSIGVVCPAYRIGENSSEGERAYWAYQTRIKADEAVLGAPIGAHGAFYLFRRNEWQDLPADTINDDVIIPMRIVARGFRAVYDTSIATTEAETTQPGQEWQRRVRIGAGNLQQAIRLASLANPARPGLAFVFLSGKALRAAMPFLAVTAELTMIAAALTGNTVMTALLIAQAMILIAARPQVSIQWPALTRPALWLNYLVEGYSASFVGAARYLAGYERSPWRKATATVNATSSDSQFDPASYVPPLVLISKRILDIVCGLGALVVMLVLFIPIAIAIKLESKGPLFYRQLRVGKVTPTTTHLFYLIKFRTMRSDAEAKSGAVWATKDDPRITRAGRFMRKTRLDELPQCINVLMGEMSVIGPRPERPGFFNKLEDAIPFYAERTYGLKPGITGLAQVNQAYDSCIEDVRNKVLYDHAYAARLATWKNWLTTDFGIIFKTVAVMATGKGQ